MPADPGRRPAGTCYARSMDDARIGCPFLPAPAPAGTEPGSAGSDSGPCARAGGAGGGGGTEVPGNRLGEAASPYLRQHADNPIHWQPWSDEAIERARREDRPIFLSIGYATCHWCHVMERESFRDPELAAFLNDHFVSIKVDREEHPDVDAFYVEAVAAMGESVGWPLNVFLTPSLDPIFGGTYFPPEPRYGRPSFRRVLEAVLEAYRTRREDVEAQGRTVTRAIAEALAPEPGPVDAGVVDRAFERLARSTDDVRGGFGHGAKFPNAPLLRAELARLRARRDAEVAAHLVRTLDAMDRGGIHDHLDGTFHRYTVDPDWHLPHFEKTLYDNAQLVEVYLQAWRILGDERWRKVAEDLCEGLASWQGPGGGLVVGFDADDPRGEGRYYAWRPEELVEVLGEADGAFVAGLFDVGEAGLAELGGGSVLHRIDEAAAARRFPGEDPADLEARWRRLRPRLAAARSERPAPSVDDKELAAWNGLAASALAEAGRLLADPRLVARFLVDGAVDGDGRPLRGRVGARSLGPAQLEDLALSALGLVRVHAATRDLRWLERAHDRIRMAFDRCYDPSSRRFRRLPDDVEPDRPVPPVLADVASDGVLPSGASAAIRAGLEIGLAAGDEGLLAAARDALAAHAGAVVRSPYGHGALLETLVWWTGPIAEVVVVGPARAPEVEAFAAVLARHPVGPILPVFFDPEDAGGEPPSALADKRTVGGRPAAYVCRRGACLPPVTDPDALAGALSEVGVASAGG